MILNQKSALSVSIKYRYFQFNFQVSFLRRPQPWKAVKGNPDDLKGADMQRKQPASKTESVLRGQKAKNKKQKNRERLNRAGGMNNRESMKKQRYNKCR